MTVKIPRGYTPLKEALNIPSEPCEHCQEGMVVLDNGRQFPCVYCDGTGFYDPDELKLARLKMAVVLCKDCEGSKMDYCACCGHEIPCEKCDGFGYLFIDERGHQEGDLPKWAIAYANSLMDEW